MKISFGLRPDCSGEAVSCTTNLLIVFFIQEL